MPTAEEPGITPQDKLGICRSRRVRLLALVGVLALLSAGIDVLFDTDLGKQVRTDPHLLSARVQTAATAHPFLCLGGFLGLYLLTSLALLPVWWLQVLIGAAFGLYEGTALSLIAGTAGALLATGISRWIGGDWIHTRLESRVVKLKKLDDALGHNGLLVVFALRLVHILPFGISNYALGLTQISLRDIAVGTFLGNIPAVAIYVGIGAGYHPWRNARFLAIVAGLNVLLLAPVGLRYLRPRWFKRWGLE